MENISQTNKNIILGNYDRSLRLAIAYYRKVKKTQDTELYNLFRDEIINLRRKLKADIKGDLLIPNKNDYESVTIIYKDPFKFDGTKDEFKRYLWENYAKRICSEYDCTGESFTTDFKVGHIGGDLWKVAECMSLDV